LLIVIVALGSRGDVQPYVALGIGLRAAGHEVRLATHESFRDFVVSHDLEFALITGDPRETVADPVVQEFLTTGRGGLAVIRHVARFGREFGPGMLGDIARACDGADAILYSFVGAAAWNVGSARGVPTIAALLQPITATRDFPAMGMPPRLRLGGRGNVLSHRFFEQMAWQAVRRITNRWRQGSLGLPPLPFGGPYAEMARTGAATMYAFSRHVVPRPTDWPATVQMTGYWFLDAAPDWQPPEALVQFLAAGPPPVYIGFGSMTPRDSERLTSMAVAALDRAGQRGILAAGWGNLGEGNLPSTIQAVRDVPHAWLFPRMSAVAHHGGAGTTAAGVRAGIPSIVLPIFGDQLFWGARTEALGVGPRAISRRALTVDGLASAIIIAQSSDRMRERASRLGALVRAEDGVARAIDRIDAMLVSRGRSR